MKKSFWVKHREASFDGKTVTLPTYWPSYEDTNERKWRDLQDGMETLTGLRIAAMSKPDGRGNCDVVLQDRNGRQVVGDGCFTCTGFIDIHWDEPSPKAGAEPC